MLDFRRKVFGGASDEWEKTKSSTSGETIWRPPSGFSYDKKENRYTIAFGQNKIVTNTLGTLQNLLTLADLKAKVKELSKARAKYLDKERKEKDTKTGTGTFTVEKMLIEEWTLAHAHWSPTVQAASQFNAQEMPQSWTSPTVGISGYMEDRTQGPAVVLSTPYDTLFRNQFFPEFNALENWNVKLTEGGYFRPKSVLCYESSLWSADTVVIPHVYNAEFYGYRDETKYRVLKPKDRFRYHQVLSAGIENSQVIGTVLDLVLTAAYEGFVQWSILDYLAAVKKYQGKELEKEKEKEVRHKAALTLVGCGVWGNDVSYTKKFIAEAVKPAIARFPIDFTLLA